MGILLAFASVILIYLFSPFLIIYSIIVSSSLKRVSEHFFTIAVSIDQLGNVIGTDFFNHVMIKEDGYKFGSPDETISSCIGKNYQTNTLKPLGRSLRFYLDRIEKDHCVKSIGE